MVNKNAQSELKNLRTSLSGRISNIEMMVKFSRIALRSAANADHGFAKTPEYAQLEKHFSTFHLPKQNEVEVYTTKAVSILNSILTVPKPSTEDIEEWISGNDYY